MQDFSALKKHLKKDFSGLPAIKVALLGDSSTQLLKDALRGCGYENGWNLEIWEADFNQLELQVFDPSSDLYAYQPDIVILFRSSHSLLQQYNKKQPGERSALAEKEMALIENLVGSLHAELRCNIIYYNYPEIDDAVYGNHANKTASSFLFQLRSLNYSLMLFAEKTTGFYLCDMSSLQNQVGKATFFTPSIYINTSMVLSIDVLASIARKTISIINAIKGRIQKCLVLDLDNTMWGGIIGDDGMENIQVGDLGIGKAFVEFQYWVKKLKERGIIIAVCSKNTEEVAREVFEKHKEMVLRLDDFAVFMVNWENKADNLRHIQSVLNIGFDSMVFLDDNPFERSIVRENVPGIIVPELPEDPAEYLEYLYSLNLFETVSVSKEDAERTRHYQAEAKRSNSIIKFTNEDDFLKSLNMLSVVEPFNAFNTPRVAQLSQRSNQFNLRTVRYTDADIEQLKSSADHVTFSFTLEDSFGDTGLICVIILSKENDHTLFIDSWFMSCRVLKRGMENFVLNALVAFARDNGFTVLKGEYIPTQKNALVKDHYQQLGFTASGNYWLLDVQSYENRNTFITKK